MGEQETRVRLLESAYVLMLAKGYAATGVDEVCKHAGVSKGSFYHFFGSKQECALEMIRHRMEQAGTMIEGGLDLGGAGGVEAAIRYVRHIEELSEELFAHGCLVGSFALELSETHPDLQQEVSRIFQGITERFEELLTPLSRACRLPGAPSGRELAEQMLTAIEGGVVLSKAHRDVRYVSQAIRLFRHYLESLCLASGASAV